MIGNQCTQLPPTQGVCTDNGGVWSGPQHPPSAGPIPPPDGVENCCEVNEYILTNLQVPPGTPTVTVLPGISAAARDERFKVVRNITVDYVAGMGCQALSRDEFYEIDQSPVSPRLDYEFLELEHPLTPVQQTHKDALTAQLDDLLLPDQSCPGDGNIDFVIDDADLAKVQSIAAD